jgi:hypothetical protein
MPAPDTEALRRLHLVNALFANATGGDLFLARQIRDAIAFSLDELERQTRQRPELAARSDADAFNAAAVTLLQKLFNERPSHGFFHWDATRTLTSATPLFARAELMDGIRAMTRFTESTLLVTNLRDAFLPPGKRATSRRLAAYDEALGYVRDLAAARLSPKTTLHLLFL